MLTITNYIVEKLEDPFGILPGDRFEFYLHIDIPEDDELYSEKGLLIKVLYLIDEKGARILQYHIIEKESQHYLDFALDDEEEQLIEAYCKEHLPR